MRERLQTEIHGGNGLCKFPPGQFVNSDINVTILVLFTKMKLQLCKVANLENRFAIIAKLNWVKLLPIDKFEGETWLHFKWKRFAFGLRNLRKANKSLESERNVVANKQTSFAIRNERKCNLTDKQIARKFQWNET
ncbi:MAG: hypothetical protein ACEY26_00500 [Candidatus Hodgkinia cicadicola]